MNIRNGFLGIWLLIVVIGQTQAQTWAPIGTKWTYTLTFAFSPNVDTLVIRSVGDTIVQGRQCRILHKSMAGCDLRGTTEYMYSDAGRVYFYDASRAKFQMLFDINAQVTDTWLWRVRDFPFQDSVIVMVDSVSSIIINSSVCKELFVKYFNAASPWIITGSGRIIENMGDDYYLFPWVFGACDGTFGGPLRCYDDNVMGHYETGVVSDCNYRSVSIPENSKPKPRISVYPNPAHGQVFIELQDTMPLTLWKVEIFSVYGTILFSGNYTIQNFSVDLKNIPSGLYLLKINLNGGEYNDRLVIRK